MDFSLHKRTDRKLNRRQTIDAGEDRFDPRHIISKHSPTGPPLGPDKALAHFRTAKSACGHRHRLLRASIVSAVPLPSRP